MLNKEVEILLQAINKAHYENEKELIVSMKDLIRLRECILSLNEKLNACRKHKEILKSQNEGLLKKLLKSNIHSLDYYV